MTDYKVFRTLAEQTARVVGARIREELFGSKGFQVMLKGPTDLVTEIDIWAEEQITAAVRREFPDHLILGEESSAELVKTTGKTFEEFAKDGYCWVLDPIDGTTNFANRIPHCAVSIALLEHGKRVAGIIYDPFREELFSAALGQGATLNGKLIHVSDKTELLGSVIATGWPHDRLENWTRYKNVYEAFLTCSRDLRRFGAATLDQCWVACGRFDAYFEYTLKPWDVAAGSLIVEEAGGKIANFSDGNDFSIFEDFFLFCNRGIFEKMYDVAKRAEAEALKTQI